jgi:hypothetical protein
VSNRALAVEMYLDKRSHRGRGQDNRIGVECGHGDLPKHIVDHYRSLER